jgi:hypothetical protein
LGVPTPKPLSLADVHELIDLSAEYLGWTPKYVNLLATTATSVFVALDQPKRLSIDTALAEEHIQVIQHSLVARGKSAKTGATYASAWRRIAAIVEGLQQAETDGPSAVKKFWASFVDNYKDPRLARRRVRRVPTTDTRVGFVTSVENGTPTKELVESTTYEVNLSQGTAVVTLPNDFSNDDVVELISVVTKHGSMAKQ